MRPVVTSDGNPTPDLFPRREVLDLAPYIPGKPPFVLESELGVRDAIKIASNENPLGPSPRAVAAITAGLRDLNRYPEGTSLVLRRALAERHGVAPEQIVIGSGSNEIIELLTHILLSPGDQAVIADPTFPMYVPAIRITGGEVVRVPVTADFRHDLAAMAAAIGPRTRLVFVCNPNNPTGTMVTAAEVERFMEMVPPGVMVVFDEAYHEYVQDPAYPHTLPYVEAQKPVAILRTFSKIYSLAALRVGYAITRPDIASLLHRVRMPFNVSTLGQIAALASLEDPHQIERSVAVNEEGKRVLTAALTALGCTVVPSVANFLLVRLPCPAAPVSAQLEYAGVIVRPMNTFRLPAEYVRITVGVQSENERLLAALGPILAADGPRAPDSALIPGAASSPPAPRTISA